MNFKRRSLLKYTMEKFYSQAQIFLKSFINLSLFVFYKILIKAQQGDRTSVLLINSEKIGDLTLCLDFLYSFSKCEVYSPKYLLIDSTYAKLLAETTLDYEIIAYNRNNYKYNFIYRIKLLKKINELGALTAINISPERGGVNDELTLLSGARNKIALRSSSLFIPKSVIKYYNKHYTRIINSTAASKYYELNDLLKYYLLQLLETKSTFKCQNIPSGSVERTFILISPSASVPFRNWSKDNFRMLVEKLVSEKNESIILIGTSNQIEILQSISDGMSNVKLRIDIQFTELLSLIWNCKIFIGLDSGLTHLALQMKKPLIAIIGGGKHGIFFPYKESEITKYLFSKMDCFGCNWICEYREPYCINNVTMQDLLAAYQELIELEK